MPEQQELLKMTPTEVVRREEPTLLEVIRELAVDSRVDVQKLAGLMQLQERAEAREAERQFNIDLAAAMAEMPTIRKDKVKDMGTKGSIPYASYENLDKIVRPIERKHGFSRIFLTEPLDKPGTRMTVKLLHKGGHSISSTRFMPPDPGPGRNDTQAIGSADSYARRYLTLAIWNLVTVNSDDDGQATGWVTDQQADAIWSLVTECGIDTKPDLLSRFLRALNAKAVTEIQAGKFKEAINLLEETRRNLKAKQKA